MKQVIAIIRMNKMGPTKKALIDTGFPAFTVRKVLGRGRDHVDLRVISGAQEGLPEAIAHLKDDGPRLTPSRMMSLTVPDDAVTKVVETFIKNNQTGQPGDGKIFVLPIEEAIRIRTGEHGAAALS
ncbi:MAG: P-II family nitrogen regulator [Verrucomicrobiota bacterium]